MINRVCAYASGDVIVGSLIMRVDGFTRNRFPRDKSLG